MRVVIKEENEEIAEQVRKSAGDTSITETVNRLLREAHVQPLIEMPKSKKKGAK